MLVKHVSFIPLGTSVFLTPANSILLSTSVLMKLACFIPLSTSVLLKPASKPASFLPLGNSGLLNLMIHSTLARGILNGLKDRDPAKGLRDGDLISLGLDV